MEKIKLFCLALAASSILFACDNRKQEGSNEGSGAAQGMEQSADAKEVAEEANENNQSALAEDEVEFLVDAADDGMFELEASRLAKEKATLPGVKSFANHMVNGHTKTNEELKNLAQSKNVTVPSSLSSYNKDKIEKLRKLSGAEFDKEYMDIMVVAHNKDVNKFQEEANEAKDGDVKAWVAKTLPVLQEHLQMAQKTQYEIGNTASQKGKNENNKM